MRVNGTGALQAGSVQIRMKPAASLSLVLYAAGLPLGTFLILLSHRRAIHDDQTLRMKGLGSTRATNPNYHVRRRFEKLYRCVHVVVQTSAVVDVGVSEFHVFVMVVPGSLFRPEMSWWRLVLLTRKFCIIAVALMLSSTPLFQAWYVTRCLTSAD